MDEQLARDIAAGPVVTQVDLVTLVVTERVRGRFRTIVYAPGTPHNRERFEHADATEAAACHAEAVARVRSWHGELPRSRRRRWLRF